MDINPNLDQFKQLAKNNNLIVLAHKFYCDWLTPLATYDNLKNKYKGESFLLESVEGEEKICRFSFLGFTPLQIFKNKGKTIYIENAHRSHNFITEKDPLFELKKIMDGFKVAPQENIRFFGGFVGYLGYDTVRFYEPIGQELPDSLNAFDSYFILPKYLVIFDHINRQIEILLFVKLDKKHGLNEIYNKEKNNLINIFQAIIKPAQLPLLSFIPKKIKIKSHIKKTDFVKAVNKVKEYIKQGEIIQMVLSQRFQANFKGDPFLAYRYLRVLNPSPYMFYLNFADVKICGSSPEMLLRCDDNKLITHPIAGTRKRGKDEQEDQVLIKDLLSDPKERAEHIMLVDLARNDLGKVASKASVNLPYFMTVEKFSHVMHIVSEVQAKLSDKENLFSALISCFPAGTVSGAPKVRAMQIINELEKEKRGIYAGCVGYFSFTNSLDTCIIIRTIVFKDNQAYIQAGAGIVYDSKPAKEYTETINKAKAQVLALQMAS